MIASDANRILVWKQVVIEGERWPYEVSNKGEVRRDGRIRKLKKHRAGYRYIDLYFNGKELTRGVHRLVAAAFIPNPEGKPQVNHRNGDKADNEASNLEWATGTENIAHADLTGLRVMPQGEAHWKGKLKTQDVQRIRTNPLKKFQYELAEIYGVSRRTIRDIQAGITWKHLPGGECSEPGGTRCHPGTDQFPESRRATGPGA